jgi:hypothetical protein
MLYFCKGPSTLVAVHSDDQIWLDPIKTYGVGCYVVVDYGGKPKMNIPPPPTDPNAPPVPPTYLFPDITPQVQSDSVKLECRRRIGLHASDQTQRNMNAHMSDIQSARMSVSPIRPATPAEQADIDTNNAIIAWIGRPNGMLGACDSLISANDLEWYQDVKWPPWDPSSQGWDAYILRF